MEDGQIDLRQQAKHTSQSTLDEPLKSMDHGQAVLAGMEAPTVEDFIEWLEEQAFRLGELGFTMGSYRDEDFIKHWSDVDDLAVAFSLENCAQEAMEQLHTEATQLQQREAIMQSNPSLLALTNTEVERRLLQAGNSDPDLARFLNSKPSLRQKVVELHKLEHRTEPREPDGVTAWVYLGADYKRKIEVNLPIKASLSWVCRLLEDIKRTEMPFLEYSIDSESTWKYDLVKQSRAELVSTGPVKLLTDADYDKMIAQITTPRKDAQAPLAILTLVGMRPKDFSAKPLTLSIGRFSATTRTVERTHRA